MTRSPRIPWAIVGPAAAAVVAIFAGGAWWAFQSGTIAVEDAGLDGGSSGDGQDWLWAIDYESDVRLERLTAFDPVLDWWRWGYGIEPGRISAGLRNGVELAVVFDEDGSPCDGALVCVLHRPKLESVATWVRGESELGSRSDAIHCAGEDGRVAIARRSGPVHVLAIAGSRRGLARVETGTPQPVEVRVRQRKELIAEVTDSRGEALSGVRVVAAILADGVGPHELASRTFTPWSEATTDPDGRAVLRDLELAPVDSTSSFGLTVDVRFEEPVFVPLDPGRIPDEPLWLRLPPMGSCIVRLVDGRGETAAIDASAVVKIANANAPEDAGRWVGIRRGISEPIRSGLGLVLSGSVMGARRGYGAWCFGPMTEGESVALEIRVPDEELERAAGRAAARHAAVEAARETGLPAIHDVVGRIVTEDSRPFRGAVSALWIQPRTSIADAHARTMTVRCDQDGRFSMKIAREYLAGGSTRVTFSTSNNADPRWSREILVAPPSSGPTIELPDPILLGPADAWIEGRVVRANEEAVPFVDLRIEAEAPPDDPYWPLREERVRTVEADVEGRFRVGFPRADLAVRIAVGTESEFGSARAEARARSGDRDVTLVLEATGTVAGSVVLPFPLPQDSLSAGLRPSARRGDPTRGPIRNQPVDWNGRFMLKDVDPGEYDLVLRTPLSRRSLAEVPDVVVRPEKLTRDPRLLSIELAGAIRIVGIGAVEPAGRPAAGAQLAVFDSDVPSEPLRTFDAEAQPVELVITDPVDVFVRAPGFRSQWLRGVAEDRTCVLDPGLGARLHLVFPKLRTGEMPDGRILVALEAVDDPFRPVRPVAEAPLQADAIEFLLDDPGDYRIRLTPLDPGADRLLRGRCFTDPAIVTIPEEAGETRVAVGLVEAPVGTAR